MKRGREATSCYSILPSLWGRSSLPLLWLAVGSGRAGSPEAAIPCLGMEECLEASGRAPGREQGDWGGRGSWSSKLRRRGRESGVEWVTSRWRRGRGGKNPPGDG